MMFIERQIIITITLQARQGAPSRGVKADEKPTFTDANGNKTANNTVKITGGGPAAKNGQRISARVTRAGAPSLSIAEVQIYNLSANLANQISTLGVPLIFMVGANSITIEAGNVGDTPTTIFTGTIYSAWRDFKALPDEVFNISAQAQSLNMSAPAKAASFKSSSPVSVILGNLAPLAQLKIINLFGKGDAEPQLQNQYLPGSVIDQIRAVCKNAKIAWSINDVSGTLTIGPRNKSFSKDNDSIPIIGPPPIGNMVGYPSYTAQGLKVTTEFTTDIAYNTDLIIKGSSIPAANGRWTVTYLDYDLECQSDNGPWFTNLELAAPGFPVLSQPG